MRAGDEGCPSREPDATSIAAEPEMRAGVGPRALVPAEASPKPLIEHTSNGATQAGIEELLRRAIDTVPALIAVMSPEGRVEFANSRLLEYTGMRPADARDDGFLAAMHPEDVSRFADRWGAALTSLAPLETEARLRRADGVYRWFLLRAAPLLDERGRALRWYGTTTDIDDLKQAENRLELRVRLATVLISKLEFRELLAGIATVLQEHLACREALLAIGEEGSGALRLYATSSPPPAGFEPGTECPLDQTPGADALTRGATVVLRGSELSRFQSGPCGAWLAHGIAALCALPLRIRGTARGLLIVGSENIDCCSAQDLRLLGDLAAALSIAVENAWAFRQISELKDRLAQEKLYLEDEITFEHNFGEIVGRSRSLRSALKEVERVAATDATVLLLGETGTGKELLARAVHRISARRDQPFVRVNCAAIPATLLESELFGYERGAFTGAVDSKIGRFELADHGTLFLDEVGDIPLEVQPKLLRAIQEREFERLGGRRTHHVDLRLIAATNRDLGAMVADGTFRRDLYYRLNVVPVHVPPLRERREDIPDLVRFFVKKYARQLSRPIETIPTASMAALQRWPWPGNVRELENVIERAVILSNGRTLEVGPLTDPARRARGPLKAASALEDAERQTILKALRQSNGIIGGPKGAAVRLGVKRTTLQSKIRRLGIRPDRRWRE